MGQEGQTLLVLANEIQARVSETQTLTADIKVWLDELQQEIRNITFAISLTKLQFEMISFFYQECESSSMEINFIDRTENQKNQVFLWSLLGASTQEAFEKIDGLLNRLKKCESLLVHLNQNMITLRVAYTAGKTEISRFADTRQVDPVFEELGKLTETAKEDSKKFGEMIEQSKNKLMDLHLLDKTVQTKVQGFKKEFKFS